MKKEKDPAFLFYSQDFIVGVQFMDFEERGKYITILSMMHQKGRLDAKTVKFLVGDISESLKSKFLIDNDGFFFNIRLESEIEKRRLFTESRKNNGFLGGRPKKTKPTDNLSVTTSLPLANLKLTDRLPLANLSGKLNETYREPNDNLIENENENENINEIKDENEYIYLLIQYGFEKKLIIEWFEIRKNKNVSNTTTFFKSFIKEVEKYEGDKNEALRICIENSWATFKKQWVDNLNNNKNGRTTSTKPNVNYSEDFIGKHLKNLQS